MQSFQDGLPPPPPVSHSWKRIDKWTEENYPELSDQLCEGCTVNDLNELEHQLDCSLPACELSNPAVDTDPIDVMMILRNVPGKI